MELHTTTGSTSPEQISENPMSHPSVCQGRSVRRETKVVSIAVVASPTTFSQPTYNGCTPALFCNVSVPLAGEPSRLALLPIWARDFPRSGGCLSTELICTWHTAQTPLRLFSALPQSAMRQFIAPVRLATISQAAANAPWCRRLWQAAIRPHWDAGDPMARFGYPCAGGFRYKTGRKVIGWSGTR